MSVPGRLKPKVTDATAPAQRDQAEVLKSRRRARNYVLAGVLLGWVVLIYLISIVRLGGAS
jgi:hypothetical protein